MVPPFSAIPDDAVSACSRIIAAMRRRGVVDDNRGFALRPVGGGS